MKAFSHTTFAIALCSSIVQAQLVARNFNTAKTCESRSIFDVLPADDFEPSDAAWDADSQLLYLVDDSGRLASIPGHYLRGTDFDSSQEELGEQNVLSLYTANHRDVKMWTVTHGLDLEGCAVDHEFPELVYLGIEEPAEIIAFNVTEGVIQHRYSVDKSFKDLSLGFTVGGNKLKKHKNNKKKKGAANSGLESLAFYPSPSPGVPSRILAGRQSDSRVFVFELSSDRKSLQFTGSVKPPGPGRDLSAISVFLGKVYFVFDKEFEAISVPMRQFEAAIKPPNKLTIGKLKTKEKKPKWTVQQYKFDIRGQEGLAFAYSSFACALGSKGCHGIGETPVVYAIDPPRKPVLEKDVLVGSFAQLQKCWRV
ncbi:uncharacterized protein BROUX77_001178 [Berkeleyomyces rouxiae]|uniref:uncharacterized protein n=1 Tax=Berkeleyomyces rouxiae TaxID=2035830 RepID=UPI003B7CC149